ncbi:MAG: cation:proton antiporter [Gammaproteobacteria bacterium]|nr:cation:proton antiporter [Gammaproteobacteria bacterium]
MEHTSEVINLVSVTFALLFVAAISSIVSKITKLPFTILLVLIGVVIAGLAPSGPHWLQAIAEFHLSPDVILFVFLPTLIFESAFALDARQLRDNLWPILTLAVPGLLLSTMMIGALMHFVAGIALAPALLLGAILSATDPVAVIALFKQLGAPKRLTILVEGESLFNDATALVLSKILVVVVLAGYATAGQAFSGVVTFLGVFLGGIVVGVIMAWLTGLMLGTVESDPYIEVSLTTVLAYSSFIVAEHLFHVSGVMAIVAAAVVMGSWGRTKISPSVVGFLHHYWEFLAYIANALIFLLVGLRIELGSLVANLPIFAVLILAMLFSRAIVIYGLVPMLEKMPNSNPISRGYQTVMYWGGLRGAIALAIVLSLPPFQYSELFTTLVAGAVLFTLIVQGLTIGGLVRKLGLDVPPLSDRLARFEGELNAKSKALSRAPELQEGGLFSARISGTLTKVYNLQLERLRDQINDLRDRELDEDQERRMLLLRCFAAENTMYYSMFTRGHLSERAYRELAHSLQLQSESIRHHGRLPSYTLHMPGHRNIVDFIVTVLSKVFAFTGLPARAQTERTARDYEEAWGRYQASNDVLEDFSAIAHAESASPEIADDVRGYYERWNRGARKIIDVTAEQFPEFVGAMQERLAKRLMIAAERESIEAEQRAGTIPPGVAEGMIDNFNHQIRALRGVKTTELEIDPTELLRKVPFFQKTPEEDFDKVAALLKPRTIPADDYIINEGAAGKSMFLIARGVVRVLRGKGDEEVVLASLLPGDFFGEMALLHDERRSASCRAVTPCALYELTREDIKRIAEVAPAIQHAMEEADAERTKIIHEK